jgi:hypothetical protein
MLQCSIVRDKMAHSSNTVAQSVAQSVAQNDNVYTKQSGTQWQTTLCT